MSESVYSESDVFATPAASLFLRSPEDAPQAGPSSPGAGGLRQRQRAAGHDAGQRDDSDNWTSSSGETNSLIQRKTVRKQFAVSTPRSVKRSSVIANGSSSVTPTRRRKDSSSNQTTPRASRDGRTTPSGRTRYRERRDFDEQDEYAPRAKRSKRGSSANNLLLALRPLRILANMLLSLLGLAISPVTNAISSFVLLLLILGTAYLFLRSPLQALTSILVPSSLIAIARPLLGPVAILHPGNLKSAYCSTIGIGCEVEPLPVARLARTVADQALQAHDIFTSVVALGNPANLGLHHTEVWELAVAVKATSDLEDKDRLGNSLKELGDLTRDTKDAMTGLNAQGINAFSWILHEFSRVEKTIDLLRIKPTRYSVADVSKQLDNLFDHLSADLSSLLQGIESTIPTAVRASDLGGQVMLALGTEHARLNKAREDMPLWRRLKDINSFAGRQLSRDLRLTGDSVANLKTTRRSLEEARGFLIGYREQVSYFKASVVGFHTADHGLEPEDEIATLREIMQKFQLSVDEAKSASSVRGARAAQPQLD